ICLFFFQAEDGIRDFHVTGVQTCALPISTTSPNFSLMARSVSFTTYRPWLASNSTPPSTIRLNNALGDINDPPDGQCWSGWHPDGCAVHSVPDRSDARSQHWSDRYCLAPPACSASAYPAADTSCYYHL